MRRLSRAWVLAVSIIVVSALAPQYGCRFSGEIRFTEDVQLQDGSVVMVKRLMRASPLGELGGAGGWEPVDSRLEIVDRASPPTPAWESDLGLVPHSLAHDTDGDGWLLLATFYTCRAWSRLEKPKLPYVQFRLRADTWERVPFDSATWTGRPANLLTDINARGEPSHIDLAQKKKRMADPRIDVTFRKVVSEWKTTC